MHLATDDQGQNEAERTNAFIGEALADGCALKTDHYINYQNMSDSQIDSLNPLERKEHEEIISEKNAWCIASDVCDRIDDEPGPGKTFMKAYVTDKKLKAYVTDNFFSRIPNISISGERQARRNEQNCQVIIIFQNLSHRLKITW